MSEQTYTVLLMQSTSHAIRAEQVLYRAGISAKLIPVPRHLSSDCGVCLRIRRGDLERAQEALQAAKVEIEAVHSI
jgi:Putative Se/S carrier protein-like